MPIEAVWFHQPLGSAERPSLEVPFVCNIGENPRIERNQMAWAKLCAESEVSPTSVKR